MKISLNKTPKRTEKPREHGLSMVMDKGLGLYAIEDLINIGAPYIDIVKLGWTTSLFTPILEEKIKCYNNANIPVYFGGTLFESLLIRNQLDDYYRMLDKYKIGWIEVSDGSMTIPHEKKCEYISELSKNYTVLSEVGSKDKNHIVPPEQWIKLMNAELDAGAWKVIGEAREKGNVGLFLGNGEVRKDLIENILHHVDGTKIIWEAPQKSQQIYFIKLDGANVNLGNISYDEVISLETIRMGLRGDTFNHFLNMDNVE